MPFRKRYKPTVIIRENLIDKNGKVTTNTRRQPISQFAVESTPCELVQRTTVQAELPFDPFVPETPTAQPSVSRYAHTRMRQVDLWTEFREKLVCATVEEEAPSQLCNRCSSEATFRCRDCGPHIRLCETCLEEVHEYQLFHCPEYHCPVSFPFWYSFFMALIFL